MLYLYSRLVETGREECIGYYYEWKTAIARITALYRMDERSAMKGCYYYFIKER
jgi:hypothetical protein